jgi:Leucine-rich repeat (LRR) protein
LSCISNQLTSLNLNSALISFWCNDNKLTSLDVSRNSSLVVFWCNDNQLTILDVSRNRELVELYCEGNQLTASALNALFGTLHNAIPRGETIAIRYNPGSYDCDQNEE